MPARPALELIRRAGRGFLELVYNVLESRVCNLCILDKNVRELDKTVTSVVRYGCPNTIRMAGAPESGIGPAMCGLFRLSEMPMVVS